MVDYITWVFKACDSVETMITNIRYRYIQIYNTTDSTDLLTNIIVSVWNPALPNEKQYKYLEKKGQQ